MELLLLPLLLVFAYLVFVSVTVFLARLFFTRNTDPKVEFYKQHVHLKSLRRRRNIAKSI